MLKSFFSAFLMYSRIPMPHVEWKEENRRYALGFFPLVGAVTGLILILWRLICSALGMEQLVFAVGAVLVSIAVTGGIHLDGFCDVTDALSSYGDRKKRLEIMSDPHIGSFAVIYLVGLLLAQTALFTEINTLSAVITAASSYVFSRGLSALSALYFRSAKKEGTLASFVSPSHRNISAFLAGLFLTAAAVLMLIFGKTAGLSAISAAVLVFLFYRKTAYKHFGGTTGDLCGWFLQLCEVWMLAAIVITSRIAEVLR